MIKDIESTFKYVKLDKEFLDEVFMAGSEQKICVSGVSQEYRQVYLARVKRDDISIINFDPVFKIANDFELTDVNNIVDTQFSKIFQNGMVKTLAKLNKAQAMQYIASYIEHEHIKIGSRMEELVDALDEQE